MVRVSLGLCKIAEMCAKVADVPPSERDYKKEYAEYHSKPEQIRRRAARNAARREMGLNKGDPREVDHKRPLSEGGSNARENLRVVSREENRRKHDD